MGEQTTENVYTDWLGNKIRVNDWIVYSSKSRNVGMNLGIVQRIGPSKSGANSITIHLTGATGVGWLSDKAITLLEGSGAYKSVTKYFGWLPGIGMAD